MSKLKETSLRELQVLNAIGGGPDPKLVGAMIDIFTEIAEKEGLSIKVSDLPIEDNYVATQPILVNSGVTLESITGLYMADIAVKIAEGAVKFLKDSYGNKEVHLYTLSIESSYRAPSQPMVPNVMLSFRFMVNK